MQMTYSPTADALAVRLDDGATSVETREIAPEVYADFDVKGRFLGVEVLNAGGFYDPTELDLLPRPGTRHHDSQSADSDSEPSREFEDRIRALRRRADLLTEELDKAVFAYARARAQALPVTDPRTIPHMSEAAYQAYSAERDRIVQALVMAGA